LGLLLKYFKQQEHQRPLEPNNGLSGKGLIEADSGWANKDVVVFNPLFAVF
jgi:hypothetical protein